MGGVEEVRRIGVTLEKKRVAGCCCEARRAVEEGRRPALSRGMAKEDMVDVGIRGWEGKKEERIKLI